jgi:hypothetical protein
MIESSEQFDEYAGWYLWAWSNLVREVVVCHTAAEAAVQAQAAGGDRDAARAAALKAAGDEVTVGRTRAGYGHRHCYIEWFVWAQSNLGLPVLCCHNVAHAAMHAIGMSRYKRKAIEDPAWKVIVENLMQAHVGACACERVRTGRTPHRSVPPEGVPRALEAS